MQHGYYDAIVVGASFAGLSVASQLKGDVLVIDRKKVGTNPTSSCGTMLDVVKKLGCEESVLQVHNSMFFHTPSKVIEFKLAYPFCVVEHWKFCKALESRVHAEIITKEVTGFDGNSILLGDEKISAKCIADCSGWRAVLASKIQKGFVRKSELSYGLQTDAKYEGEGMHFFINTSDRMLYRWFFPSGNFSRFGAGSWNFRRDAKAALLSFLSEFEVKGGKIYGGFFPHAMRTPIIGNIFLAGDSAGQCLPMSGEGIRPSLYYGKECGRIMQEVLNGKISLREGQKKYKNFVMQGIDQFMSLEWFQMAIELIPRRMIALFFQFIGWKPLLHALMVQYRKVCEPEMV